MLSLSRGTGTEPDYEGLNITAPLRPSSARKPQTGLSGALAIKKNLSGHVCRLQNQLPCGSANYQWEWVLVVGPRPSCARGGVDGLMETEKERLFCLRLLVSWLQKHS